MIGNIKEYLNNRISLTKLEVIESVGKGLAKTTSLIVLIMFFLFMYFFLMVGFSWYLGEYFFDNTIFLGFITIGGVHFLLFIIALVFRKELIENPVLDIWVQAAFNRKKKQNENS